jgi:hypothetical protein
MSVRVIQSLQIQPDIADAIYTLPDPDGSFAPAQQHLFRRLGVKRKALVLAFPPKAAGTFLRAALIKAVDGQLVRIVHAQAGRDATPYLPTLLRYYDGGVSDKTLVTHVHMLALPANLHLLSAFGIKPVIMIRSIPDMLASYWDMLETDDNALHDGLNCHIPWNFRALTRNAKADFIIDILAPWYVNFYAGWIGYARMAPETVLMIDYRAMQQNSVAVVGDVLKHVGLPRDTEACEAAVAYAWRLRDSLRYNKGESGRGANYFRSAHLNRLSRMVGHYPVLADWHQRLLELHKATA